MSIAEQLRALVAQLAQLQRVADWETQIELAKAATILVGEAGRLEGLVPRLPRLSDAIERVAVKVQDAERIR